MEDLCDACCFPMVPSTLLSDSFPAVELVLDAHYMGGHTRVFKDLGSGPVSFG